MPVVPRLRTSELSSPGWGVVLPRLAQSLSRLYSLLKGGLRNCKLFPFQAASRVSVFLLPSGDSWETQFLEVHCLSGLTVKGRGTTVSLVYFHSHEDDYILT